MFFRVDVMIVTVDEGFVTLLIVLELVNDGCSILSIESSYDQSI